ncbi:uncharacterized protein VP01_601g5 [Puccinia sorghi]|uniref:Uncharacterized protein n=1 Tax=Puccinia sorghi TaxID=27349 RepID=A0A0L6UHC7_9BASI|nr:uncharacterized protein VP01_601g5 [Puccinia sorghi]
MRGSCFYVVYDFECKLADSEGKRNKLCFFTWYVSCLINTRQIPPMKLKLKTRLLIKLTPLT